MATATVANHDSAAHDHHDHEHHDNFVTKYLFTQDSPGSFIEQIPSISYFDELLVGFYYTEGFKKQLEQAKKDLEETKKQHKKLQENLEQFKELSRPEDFFRDTLTEKDLEIPILGEDQKYKKDVA